MSANANDQAPIFITYMHIMKEWLSDMESWADKWLKLGGRELKVGPFQSIMFYPFHSGTFEGDATDPDNLLCRKTTEFAENMIPLYGTAGKLYTVSNYARKRSASEFLKNMKTAKSAIRDREGIAASCLNAIRFGIPWEEDYAENVQLFVDAYIDVLERICLYDATEVIRKEAGKPGSKKPDFYDVIIQADYFSDILFGMGRAYEAAPDTGRAEFIACAVEVTEDLMVEVIERLQSLVQKIMIAYTEDIPPKLGEIISSKKFKIQNALERAYTIQHDLMLRKMTCISRRFARESAAETTFVDVNFLYRQHLAEKGVEWKAERERDSEQPFSPEKIEVDFHMEQEYCAAMGCAFQKLKVFQRYYETLCKAALLLYFGVYLHFSSGNDTIYADLEGAEIELDNGYYIPMGLPLSMETLRKFTNTHRACLLCGGGGSGKSTYLKKLAALDAKGLKSFSLVAYIPLRYLVSDHTEQDHGFKLDLESSLIWQKVKQLAEREKTAGRKKNILQIEQNLNKRGSGLAPVLLLLDGYNEVLSIQNDVAIMRLQNDIRWLSSQENIRVIMTYRAEDRLLDSEMNTFASWFFASPAQSEDVFYITYDAKKMMEIIHRNKRLKNTSERFMTLLKTRPMYLNALKYLDNTGHATQYGLLDSIYRQRCSAVVGSPMARDGQKPRWLALYTIILPNLAYRMVVEGTQVIDRYRLHQELREILADHRADLGNCYWWQCDETCGETASYPFKHTDSEMDVDWIERALLSSDRILEHGDHHTIAFFHEDIRNYLAARHIAQRFAVYVRYAEENCCYHVPIHWEKLPNDMIAMVYEALAHISGIEWKQDGESIAVQLLNKIIFPAYRNFVMPEFITPGNLMRFMLASQIQEYEKRDRKQLTESFAAHTQPLAKYCLEPEQDLMKLPQEARAVLSRVLYRMSGIERLERNKPVPKDSFTYAELAVSMSADIYPAGREVSIWKTAQHYLAKAFLAQAQYLWTRCGDSHRAEADQYFLQGYALLKICAEEDRNYGSGVNLSLNLLGLWQYAPAPLLQRCSVFRENIGGVDYARAFLNFFNSVKFAPPKSANRPYAAMKCVAMLLEQQVFLPDSLDVSSLNELAVYLKRNPGDIMTSESVCHGVFALSSPRLSGNLLATGLFLEEIVDFSNEPHSYYRGLYHLYCEAQGKNNPSMLLVKAGREFRLETKNRLKDELCIAFIKAIKSGSAEEWRNAADNFTLSAKAELECISPDDLGEIDAGHRCNNQCAYQNLLGMLSLEFELRQQRQRISIS